MAYLQDSSVLVQRIRMASPATEIQRRGAEPAVCLPGPALPRTLISLQGKEFYIEELIKLDEADKVLENLDAIVDDLGKTINDLKDIQEKISS